MRKGELIPAVAAALLLATGSALAESAAASCTAAGGTYTKDGGTAICTFPVGNSDNTKITDQRAALTAATLRKRLIRGALSRRVSRAVTRFKVAQELKGRAVLQQPFPCLAKLRA